jgi:hypothetical protein
MLDAVNPFWQDYESGVPSGKAVGATQRLEAHWKFASKEAGLDCSSFNAKVQNGS